MNRSVFDLTARELVEHGMPQTNEALQADKEMTRRLNEAMDEWSKRLLIANWVATREDLAMRPLEVTDA